MLAGISTGLCWQMVCSITLLNHGYGKNAYFTLQFEVQPSNHQFVLYHLVNLLCSALHHIYHRTKLPVVLSHWKTAMSLNISLRKISGLTFEPKTRWSSSFNFLVIYSENSPPFIQFVS